MCTGAGIMKRRRAANLSQVMHKCCTYSKFTALRRFIMPAAGDYVFESVFL